MSSHLKPNLGLKPVKRPLLDLNGFSATMASHINDLPTTSPHGSDFGLHPQILGLASDPNAIRGTATAQCTCVAAFICNSLNSIVERKFAMSVAVAFYSPDIETRIALVSLHFLH